MLATSRVALAQKSMENQWKEREVVEVVGRGEKARKNIVG